MFGRHSVETEDPFWLFGGGKLHSLYDLLEALERIDDATFSYHVSSKKNDFAIWVKHSIKNNVVADNLAKARSRQEAIDYLKNYLYKYEDQSKTEDEKSLEEIAVANKKEDKKEKKGLFSRGKKKDEEKPKPVESQEPSQFIPEEKPEELKPLEPLEFENMKPLEPLQPLNMNELNSYSNENEKLKDDIFKPEEKKGFFSKLFSRRKKEEFKPLEPISLEPLQSDKAMDQSRFDSMSSLDLAPPKQEFKLEEFSMASSIANTEKKMKEEGIIKSDFSLKELPPAGEKEVKAENLSKKEEARLKHLTEKHKKTASKKKKLSKKEIKEMQSLIKKQKQVIDLQMREKAHSKKLKGKGEALRTQENVVLDKAISLEAKETRIEKLRKELEKKDTILDTREKELSEQHRRYNEMIKDLERLKKETYDELKKKQTEHDRRESELKNKEAYLRKKEKELEIEDRAIDYAMSEFEKEKLKLEDDEFHAYLKSKVGEMHGIPAGKKISVNDVEKVESMKVPNMTDKKLSASESMQKCRDLLKQGRLEEAKYIYNGLRLEFFKKNFAEPEKTKVYNQLRELYDDINLASLARR